ncbi:MAG: AMP-binding protein, partial [Candidatus Glassbacteria bacterium]|nr:AMP-binding protein [Candidatus Glassbacteria bacterium]
MNLEPGTKIALLGKNSAHWILSDLAVMMAGHVTVPLYPTLTGDGARQILEHSESKLVFVGKLDDWGELKNGIPKGMPIIELPLAPPTGAPKWEQIVAETEPLEENVFRDPGELATLIYTSGTTGTPKGVMINFSAMIDAAKGAADRVEISSNDRLISYLPLAHCYERLAVESSSIFNNIHVFFAESLDTFVADLQRARPTFFCSVPRLWVKFQAGVFAKVPKDKLERLLSIPIVSWLVRRKVLKGLGLDKTRVAISGAAPLPEEVILWYHSLGLELLEAYGMTENFAYSHGNPPGDIRVGTVGTPASGVETRISEEGEVLVKSLGTMMGYYKAPEMTAEVLTEDGFLRTGDLGVIDEDGYLRITGRVKELFKTSKGKYISPSTIENLLMNHPLVEQACVCGLGYDQPFALIMPSEEVRRDMADGTGKERIAGELEKLIEQVNA